MNKITLPELLARIQQLSDKGKATLLNRLNPTTKKKSKKFIYTPVKMTQTTTCRFCGARKVESYNVNVLALEIPQCIEHTTEVPWCAECETSENLIYSDKKVIIAKALEIIKSLQWGKKI